MREVTLSRIFFFFFAFFYVLHAYLQAKIRFKKSEGKKILRKLISLIQPCK